MNTACPRRVSLISALGLPTILSPTIGATSGDRPAARRFGSRLSPALQASSFARRLAHPHRPNRVHRGCPLGQPVLRTGRSRSVALHPALLRCSYGSIPHSSSPHRSGLSPLYPTALSGARAHASRVLPTASRHWPRLPNHHSPFGASVRQRKACGWTPQTTCRRHVLPIFNSMDTAQFTSSTR
jgi:hypothetical protein